MNTSSGVEATAVQFSFMETELFSGTNRGMIYIWDAITQKQLATLRGHTAAVSCFGIFPGEEQQSMLLSGGLDTVIKLWDSRQKSTVGQFKGHGMQINALCVSPDSKMMASASQDCIIKLWDIGTQKLICNLSQHDSCVTCLDFDPENMALASGGADRSIKYWDLKTYSVRMSTRTDSTPIQCLKVQNEIYSATQESLKVWSKEGQLLDNVESMWRGVQDLLFSTDQLYGLSVERNSASLHSVQLKSINLDPKAEQPRQSAGKQSRGRTPDKINLQQQQPPQAQIQQQPKISAPLMPKITAPKIISKPSFQVQAQNIIVNPEYNYPIDLDSNIMDSQSLTLSSFIVGKAQKEKFQQVDLINEITKDHARALQILKQRAQYMKPILNWWNNKNYKAACTAIIQLSDASVIQDSLILIQFGLEKIPLDQFSGLIQQARVLIDNKYVGYIKSGIEFLLKVVDSCRGEKTVMDEITEICKGQKMQKVCQINKEGLSDIARRLVQLCE